ncbi:hypothetical protein ACR78J_19310 [Sphingobacterium spiritivorum]|uniref:hypothetical protein n=1 Tax=Sphingobacterium spiritivorum TaxID=258 RepID=UPI003DA2BCCD
MKAIHNWQDLRVGQQLVVVNIIKSKNRPYGSSAIPLKNKSLMANESNSQQLPLQKKASPSCCKYH